MHDKAIPETLYGIKSIAAHVGMTERQASYRSDIGQLPTFKMGRTLCAKRATLDAWLSGLARQTKSGGAPA